MACPEMEGLGPGDQIDRFRLWHTPKGIVHRLFAPVDLVVTFVICPSTAPHWPISWEAHVVNGLRPTSPLRRRHTFQQPTL